MKLVGWVLISAPWRVELFPAILHPLASILLSLVSLDKAAVEEWTKLQLKLTNHSHLHDARRPSLTF